MTIIEDARQPFTAGRDNGKSDARVVFELFEGRSPGDTVSYDTIIEALKLGLDDPSTVDRHRVYQSTQQARKWLLDEQQRALVAVIGYGYRVAHAHEQVALSRKRHRSAVRQQRERIRLLQNARFDEMTDGQRNQHVSETVLAVAQQTALESTRRHERSDSIISGLLQGQRKEL